MTEYDLRLAPREPVWSTTTHKDPLEDVVTHRELAEFLGVSERSLYSYRIPRIALGKIRLYFKADVADWLRKRQESQRG